MPSGKHRLYIALYARGGKPMMPEKEDTYHWGLIVGPKKEVADSRGARFHAKEVLSASTGKIRIQVRRYFYISSSNANAFGESDGSENRKLRSHVANTAGNPY